MRVIIMGAAGRDFHDFLSYYKGKHEVVAFTATQIPGIEKRRFPAALAGKRYPQGIPIYPEERLAELIKKYDVDEVAFSYSDVTHEHVMHKASIALAAGASFRILSYADIAYEARVPVISVCAVRTGSGKSQVSRKIAKLLTEAGKHVSLVRHPMPYGNLVKQRVQTFTAYEDLKKAACTIEEREEYEPHLRLGVTVYAGVDYKAILQQAQKADIIIWDGGNNDVPFYKSDLHIVVADPLRPGDELHYHPGEENFRMADLVIINKMDTAKKRDVETVLRHVKALPDRPEIIKANSKVHLEGNVRGKRVLVIEDGPTLTHGGMGYGAGVVAARQHKAKIIDPRKYAVGSIKQAYNQYPTLGKVVPALGYGKQQLKELAQTINNAPVDAVIVATPADLSPLLKVDKPLLRVTYELEERHRTLKRVLQDRGFL